MKNVLIRVSILGLFFVSFLSYDTFAGEAALAVTAHNAVILFMQGDVKVKQAAFDEWVGAAEGMALFPGDTLKTGDGSWVEIGVGSNQANVIRVKENTLVELTSLGPVKINLLKGELRALVEKLDKNEVFEMTSPVSVCGIRGTGWDKKTDGKQATVDVYENNVYFSGVSVRKSLILGITLLPGKRGVLKDPEQPILIKDVPADKIKDWKKWKKDFLERRGGVGGKAGGAAGQKQKAADKMAKGKEGILEKKDQLLIENRTSMPESSGTE